MSAPARMKCLPCVYETMSPPSYVCVVERWSDRGYGPTVNAPVRAIVARPQCSVPVHSGLLIPKSEFLNGSSACPGPSIRLYPKRAWLIRLGENTCESLIDNTRLKNSMFPPPVPGNWNALLPIKLQIPWNCGVFDQKNFPDKLFFCVIFWSMLALN